MSLYDLIVRHGTLVTPAGGVEADLAIAGDRIAAIEPQLSGTAEREIDARGLTLLHTRPGCGRHDGIF